MNDPLKLRARNGPGHHSSFVECIGIIVPFRQDMLERHNHIHLSELIKLLTFRPNALPSEYSNIFYWRFFHKIFDLF